MIKLFMLRAYKQVKSKALIRETHFLDASKIKHLLMLVYSLYS